MKTKKKKQRKRKLKEMLQENQIQSQRVDLDLYTEDLGTQGVKKKGSEKRGSISDFKVTKKENKRRKQREARFSLDSSLSITGNDDIDDGYLRLTSALSTSRSSYGSSSTLGGKTSRKHNTNQVVGTCTKLEKSYFRLTTFPKAESIRPLPVLKMSLERIKKKYIAEEDFEWANDQLKAVRQDITVQGIQNNFCLEVYETHARILLEHGDLNEFNQCQSMIRNLTTKKTQPKQFGEGKENVLQQRDEYQDEFQAYQLIYSLIQRSWTDLTTILACNKNNKKKERPSCEHAMSVIKSIINHDYQSFFELYESPPNLSAYLMDFLVGRVRDDAYERIVSSFRPTLDLKYFQERLQFEDLQETKEFLRKKNAVLIKKDDIHLIDCKLSNSKLRAKKI